MADGFRGANPQDLDGLAAAFSRADRVSSQALERLEIIMRPGYGVQGPAGDQFRQSLRAVRDRLTGCAGRLGPLAADMRAQAEQQRRASSSGGGRADPGGAPAPEAEPRQVAGSASGPLVCLEGNCLVPAGGRMTPEMFSNAVPPAVRGFEQRIIGELYRNSGDIKDLETMMAAQGYHAYTNVTVIGQNVNPDRLWHEYLRSPAPTLTGPHDQPVDTGSRTYDVFAFDSVVQDNPIATPWPGGVVRHVVDHENRIIANVTTPAHTLHPGYIIRWIETVPGPDGPIYRSWTLGRGTGIMGPTNEVVGSRIFHELDQRIGQRVSPVPN